MKFLSLVHIVKITSIGAYTYFGSNVKSITRNILYRKHFKFNTLTDREFAYKQLTERKIKSGDFTFEFDSPDFSPLSNFRIYDKGYNGIFGSEYSVTDSAGKIVVRIKMSSSDKVFYIDTKRVNKEMSVAIGLTYFEVSIEDFLYILSNELWIVADTKPQS